MSKIDYQALRAKAEKATCGEWSLEYGKGRFDGDDALIHREVAGYIPVCRIEGAHPESGFDEDFQMEQQANAEFIAAANPATVLTLLDEREAQSKHIAELETNLVALAAENAGIKSAIPQLRDNDADNDNMDDVSLAEDFGFNHAIERMKRRITEIPAADAFLADVRAGALNDLCTAFVRHAKVAGLDDADTVTLKEVTEALLHCAEQIRAPE
ncbi:ead/Ea22-like family protein [Escherichia sp. DSM 109009]|uniref:ead/Ea22-like family protein n=1 Tax=Escherichia TaxID=561 RepID=UPI000B7CDB77|nr:MULTISPECIES: ead/Ea22-like family protein [Escherichia]EEW1584851.1 ead/Ea22-like family protein [Escherichia coli]EIY0409315.1 ead/Ea22-like family protein [Escherichia coli]EJF3499367.1 ead/Ea22-like family protein [Escherichia coli]ELZ3108928.1 ead/Ea22-like family protein [Escherichia coli]MBE5070931.1 ead/Ea22-like family protein [Escherichia sp. DSM 109009]